MKSKMKRRMLAIVLCMVIVLSNSSFIFASSESGTPAVEAAGTEGTTSQTETDTQVTETTPQTLAVSESTPAPTDESAAPTSVEATPTPTDTPEVTTTPEPTGTPTPEATPTPTDTPETTTTPEPTDAPEITTTPELTDTPEATTTPEPTNTPEATPTPTQGPEDGTSDTAQPTATPTPTEAPVKSNEAVELKQEFKDSDGNVTSTVKAQIAEGTFAADASEITMEVQTPDTASAEHVKEMMEELLPENHMLGDYIFYDIQFKVNGTATEPQKPITITFEGNELSVKDVKRANVFWLDPEDPQVDGDKDQLVEITQKSEMIENLQNSGQSTENIDDYDLSEITLKEDGISDKIQMEGRTSTIYGCYVVYEPVQVLTYDDDQVTVTVSAAEEGIIPANAELKVVPIIAEDKNTEDQYKEVEQKLQEKAEEDAYDIAGFLAYDITFVDEDGNETEPGGEVKVSIDYKEAAIPETVSEEDAANAEVTVLHLEEDEKGEVKEVVDMAQDEKVDVLATTEENKVEKAEVRTESFSVFTITWSYSRYYQFTITAHYVYQSADGSIVDIQDEEIPDYKDPWEKSLKSGSRKIDLTTSDYQINIPGYTHLRTVADDKNSESEITYLEKYSAESWGTTYYYIKNDNDEEWLSTERWGSKEGDIYFVYQKTSGLQVFNNIINEGDLQAVYTPTEDNETVTDYRWLKSETKDGTYDEVKNLNFENGDSIISEDGSSLYPAYDKGARKWYKVEATLSDGTKVTSNPIQVPYYDELQNGSFEIPVVYKGSNLQYGNEEYTNANGVWQSTAEVWNGYYPKNVAIEIVHEGRQGGDTAYSWYQNWNDATPYGEQFAELNCQAAGALYQDVLTVKGTPLNYWLSHRARGNEKNWESELDTMYLVIMPTSIALENDLTTQENLEEYLRGLNSNIDPDDNGNQISDAVVYKQNGILVVRVTSDDQSWHEIFEFEGYTPTSSLTRFFFVAGGTETGDKTIGNFLDRVGFSQGLPEGEPDEFTLLIKKEISGLANKDLQELKSNLKFKISATKNGKELEEEELINLFGVSEISGSEMTESADGNTLTYDKIVNKPINGTYEVTITEEGADLERYNRTSSSKVTIDGQTSEAKEGVTAELTLQSETQAIVEYTNTYESTNYKNVNFTKVWDDKGNAFGTRPQSLDVTLHGSISYEENGNTVVRELTEQELGVETTQTLTGESWSTSWKVPVYYEISRTDGTKAKIKIQYTVSEGTINSDYVYEAGTLQNGNGKDYQYHDFNNVTITGDGEAITKPKDGVSKANANSLASSDSQDKTNLGEPNHRKYITYNEATDDYTLSLDVTGKKGEAEGVDVLFVIDTSGSMADDSLLWNVKNLLTDENGIIDQILSGEDNVNSVAYVSFAGKSETKTSSWYGKSSSSSLKRGINSLRATGGTNWTYAMMKAADMLETRANSGNEKVMIFLSDGEPTYSINERGREYGYGNRTANAYYEEAIAAVTASEALNQAQKYSVYLNAGTAEGMREFAQGTGAELVSGIALQSALESILNKIIPTYEDVSITDTLSAYVEFSEGTDPTVIVTKNGVRLDDSQYSIEKKVNSVTVHFNEELEDGATYTISFRIKPSQAAIDYLSENNGEYPDQGDPNTGSTSANQEGFYSNNDDETKLTYSIKGTENKNLTAKYPRPVVQVTTHNLTFIKEWNKPENVESPEEVVLDVLYTDGTTDVIKLTGKTDWTVTKNNVPATKKIQNVTERSLQDYTPSYEISSDGTSVTVTNSYSKIETTNINVVKEWSGNGPKSDVKVSLYYSENNGDAEQLYQTVVLNEENHWTHTWEDLDKQDWAEGKNYTYAVREEQIPDNYTSNITYSTEGDTTTVRINNVYDPNCADENFYIANVLQTIPLTVTKIWDDHNDIQGERPESLGVTVTEGGHVLKFTLSEENNWTKNVNILKRKDQEYSAQEDLNGIASSYDKVDDSISVTDRAVYVSFTNQIKTKSITVQKAWIDNDVTNRPGSIGFALYRNGALYDNYTLSAEDIGENGTTWTKVIENLPITGDYEVKELALEEGYDYNSSVVKSEDGVTFTITNRLNWHVIKTSKSLAGEETVNLEGARFELKQNGTPIATGQSGSDGEIIWEPNSSLNNLTGDYQLVETQASSGYVLHEAGWTLTFENGLLKSAIDNETQAPISVSTDAQTGARVEVTNDKIYMLPSAGSSGIFGYTMGGTLLLMAGTLILYKMKRKEVQES